MEGAEAGHICADTINEGWKPTLTIKHILETLKFMLANPGVSFFYGFARNFSVPRHSFFALREASTPDFDTLNKNFGSLYRELILAKRKVQSQMTFTFQQAGDTALEEDIAAMIRDDPKKFKKKAMSWTKKYAM